MMVVVANSTAAIPGLHQPQASVPPSAEVPAPAEMDENEKIMALVQGAGGWHDDLKCDSTLPCGPPLPCLRHSLRS
jgi:hypothetical protein